MEKSARPTVDPDYSATVGLDRDQAHALAAAADPRRGSRPPGCRGWSARARKAKIPLAPATVAALEAYLTDRAERISRAKRRIAGLPLDQPGNLETVLRVLYLVFNEGYSGNVDLAAEAIRLTLPHPAARQLVSGHSLNYYFALRDSFGSSGCMVSSSDLGGDDSGGRGGGDRRAWSRTGQSAALPDRAPVTATRPRSGGRASAWRRLAGAAVPRLWRPGAGLRAARGGWSRPA